MASTATEGEASKLLLEYEHLNSDLPRSTRRQLGLFVIAPRVGKKALEALFRRSLAGTPWYHRSWMWYTCLRTAGLERYWDELARRRNSGEGFDDVLRWLESQTTEQEWRLLSRRLGVPIFHDRDRLWPGQYSSDTNSGTTRIWTAGGTWDRRDPFAKIIVLGEHLGPRGPGNTWTDQLSQDDIRRLERELHNLIDPDEHLVPHAKRRAVRYIRRRIPEILGYDRRAGLNTAAWFFMDLIPNEDGFFQRADPDRPPRLSQAKLQRWYWWDDEEYQDEAD